MDDYLTKPLDISRLQDVLDRFMGRADGEQRRSRARRPRPRGAERRQGDPRAARRRRRRRRGVHRSSWSTRSCPAARKRCRSCAPPSSSATPTAIGRAAHKLKGAAANLHVNDLATLTFDLETRAKSGQKSDWRAELEKIAAEFARVGEGLRTEFGLEEPARKARMTVGRASAATRRVAAEARPTACYFFSGSTNSCRLLRAAAEEELLHFLDQELARLRLDRRQPVLVQQHRLVLEPALPRFLGNVLVDALPELAGIRRVVEAFGLDAEQHAFHQFLPWAAFNPCAARCASAPSRSRPARRPHRAARRRSPRCARRASRAGWSP